jgi:hypothetical protein
VLQPAVDAVGAEVVHEEAERRVREEVPVLRARRRRTRPSCRARRDGLEEQMRFAIREGGRTVGAGIVTKVIE